jgi:hypothetical protein
VPPVDRTALIAIADSYLDALTSRDPTGVPLAPDVTRSDHGALVASTADAIRAIIEREPVGEITGRRHLVDDDSVVVTYDLDVEEATVYLMERFHIVDGLIRAIEPVYAIDTSKRPRPHRPSRYPTTAPGRDDVIAVAGQYLDALVSHVGTDVPLAAEAWRIEDGHNSGDRGPAIAAALELDIMTLVAGITDIRWYVEGDTAIAFYTLHVDPGLVSGSTAEDDAPRRVAMAERFRVYQGTVCEIEAVIGAEM